jgi:hypothetical protein
MFIIENITFFCTIFNITTVLCLLFYLCKRYPDKRELFKLKEKVYKKKLEKMKGAELVEGLKKFREMEIAHEIEKLKEEVEIKEKESKKSK